MRERNRKKEQYWIDCDGKSHYFSGDDEKVVSIHNEIASTIYPESNRPTDILFNFGWIMIGSTVYHTPIIHKKPTNKQITKLKRIKLYDRLCILHENRYINYDKYYS